MFSISNLLAASSQNNNNNNGNSTSVAGDTVSKKVAENRLDEKFKFEDSQISDIIFPTSSTSPTPATNLFQSASGHVNNPSLFWLNPAAAAAVAAAGGGGGATPSELQHTIATSNSSQAFEQYLMMAKRSRKYFIRAV